ncbi:MAG: DsbE family thiol:disulfide interchange protein [Acetobacteraceae bacterium]|nr:DsbE family thiol:disulfide interchange protein [Acetobacteraceae bacterium]MBV8524720.1 DsbE family thiol:disulfide interchange protein [Acetobacteraceae bacterium]
MISRRALLLAPLGMATLTGISFWMLLDRMRTGKFDPHAVPNPLIGQRLPDFSLPGQPPSPGFSAADITASGRPALVNFFASWCLPCVAEAPQLMALRRAGIPVWGIAYKDPPEATAAFLARNGYPYTRVARDEPGRVAIDFGVYGVPETYLIDKTGIIRWRWAGALTEDVIEQQLQPLLRQYS